MAIAPCIVIEIERRGPMAVAAGVACLFEIY